MSLENVSPLRKFAMNAGMVLISLTIGILLAEVCLRFFEAGRLRTDSTEIPLDRLNYNNLPVTIAGEPGTRRALSFGDSFAYGIVKPKFTYHQIAAQQLAGTDAAMAIVNLGEPAISFPQYIESHRQWSSLLSHDMVLFNLYVGNDIADVSFGYVDKNADPHHALAALGAHAESGAGLVPSGNLDDILSRVNFIPRAFSLRVLDYAYAVYLSMKEVIGQPDSSLDPAIYNRAVLLLTDNTYLEVQQSIATVFDPSKLPVHAQGYVSAVSLALYLQRQSQERPVQVILSPPHMAVDENLRSRLIPQLDLTQELDLDLPFVILEQIFSAVAPDVQVLALDAVLRCATRAIGPMYVERDTHWSQAGNQVVGHAVAAAIGGQQARELNLSGVRCAITSQRRAPTTIEANFLQSILETPPETR